ncbi:hypothetical protein CR513_24864, partial [Mucuna pruriens]
MRVSGLSNKKLSQITHNFLNLDFAKLGCKCKLEAITQLLVTVADGTHWMFNIFVEDFLGSYNNPNLLLLM